MNINELIIKKENELTEKQQAFLKLHSNIISAGMLVSNGLINLSENLKKMRDDKLYIEAGYNSFEDYAELACGLKRRQAYNYIKIIECLDKDFVHSNAQIGITKLSLLATLSEEDKDAFLNKVNVEDITVSELKKEIEKLKSEVKDNNNLLDEKLKLEVQVKDLKNKIDEFKSQEPKTVIVEKDNSEKFNKELEELNQKLIDTKEKLKKRNEEINLLQLSKESLTKQLLISNSNELIEFKLLFNDLQNLVVKINNIIPKLPEDKKQGCQNALKKVVEELC